MESLGEKLIDWAERIFGLAGEKGKWEKGKTEVYYKSEKSPIYKLHRCPERGISPSGKKVYGRADRKRKNSSTKKTSGKNMYKRG